MAKRAEVLLLQLFARSASFKHNLLLIPYGNDFHYQHADWMFGNMSLLIDYINNHHSDQIFLQYATLSQYFNALNAIQGEGFPSRAIASDFHPYSWTPDDENSWWTGFYFSRPCLKVHV